MINELRLMAIFAKTMELQSFRKAGEQLGLGPSVISHHIAQLESRLGVTLLYRSTRKLSATQEGVKLYEAAKAMIECAENGLKAINSYSQEQSGELRLSVPSILIHSFLIEDLAEFTKKYPKVKLNINFSDKEKDLIKDGIDVAVRIGPLENSGMKSRRIYEIQRKLVASSKLLKNIKPIRKPEDLVHQKWIGIHMLPHFRNLISREGSKFKVEFDPIITVDSVHAAFELAKKGAGFATPPEFLVSDELKSVGMVEVLPQWHLPPLPVYVLWHSNTVKTSLSALFKDFLILRESIRQ